MSGDQFIERLVPLDWDVLDEVPTRWFATVRRFGNHHPRVELGRGSDGGTPVVWPVVRNKKEDDEA